MRILLPLLLMITATTASAVSKQDIQICQTLGSKDKVSQCIALLKDNRVRNQLIECRKSLKCWSDQYRSMAQYNCDNAFRISAAASPQWRAVWSGQKLNGAAWLSRKSGTMTYFSDKNGIRLECRFNPRFPEKVKTRYMLSNS